MDEEASIQQINDMAWDILDAVHEWNDLARAERHIDLLTARVRELLRAAAQTRAGTT